MRHRNHKHAEGAFAQQHWADVIRLLPGAELSHGDDARMHAIALSETGHPQLAMAMLEPFLEAEPGNTALHINAASIFRRMGELDRAESLLRAVLSADPDCLPAQLNLANLLRADARLDEAAPEYRRVIELQPRHLEARVALAEIDKAEGRIAEAVAGFRYAAENRPGCGAAWWGIANLKTQTFSSADLQMLDLAWRDLGLPPKDREPLGFARASAHAQRSSPEHAWAVLVEANANVAKRRPFQVDAFERTISSQMARLAPAANSADAAGQEVIFIVGLPRSGSTLLEQILAAHPQVAAASELPDFPALIQGSKGGVQDLRTLGQQYLARTARWRRAKPRHVDKWPANFLHVADILQALPGARVIECRRDARDNALSCFQQYFALGNAFSFDLDAIARYGRGCRALMDRAAAAAPGQVMVVHYEQLVAEPEQVTRQVLEFSGLSWHPGCLHPEHVVRTVRTASAAQVREPMDQRGVGRYRKFQFAFDSWDSNGKM